MPIYGFDDPAGWYQKTFGNPIRPMRYDPSFKDDCPALQDRVDFRVQDMAEHLSRGNLNRLFKLFGCNLSKSVFYACARGDSVGDGVAIDFETGFAKWFWSPNFDSPPHAPPKDGLLGDYVREYVGTRSWLATQLNMERIDVANALAGQSKAKERIIRPYLHDFYDRRCAIDVRNPNYEAELARYKLDMDFHGTRVFSLLTDMFEEERSTWAGSAEARYLARRQRELGSFADAYDSLRKEGIDPAMATLSFQPWCAMHRKKLLRLIPSVPNHPSEWEYASPPKRLNP